MYWVVLQVFPFHCGYVYSACISTDAKTAFGTSDGAWASGGLRSTSGSVRRLVGFGLLVARQSPKVKQCALHSAVIVSFLWLLDMMAKPRSDQTCDVSLFRADKSDVHIYHTLELQTLRTKSEINTDAATSKHGLILTEK